VFSLGKGAITAYRDDVFGRGLKTCHKPHVVLAILFAGFLVIDRGYNSSFSDKLVREQDDIPGQESYDVWFVDDGNGSLICSQKFEVGHRLFINRRLFFRKVLSRPSGRLRVRFRRQGYL
jgi:hypothetical protein